MGTVGATFGLYVSGYKIWIINLFMLELDAKYNIFYDRVEINKMKWLKLNLIFQKGKKKKYYKVVIKAKKNICECEKNVST